MAELLTRRDVEKERDELTKLLNLMGHGLACLKCKAVYRQEDIDQQIRKICYCDFESDGY